MSKSISRNIMRLAKCAKFTMRRQCLCWSVSAMSAVLRVFPSVAAAASAGADALIAVADLAAPLAEWKACVHTERPGERARALAVRHSLRTVAVCVELS